MMSFSLITSTILLLLMASIITDTTIEVWKGGVHLEHKDEPYKPTLQAWLLILIVSLIPIFNLGFFTIYLGVIYFDHVEEEYFPYEYEIYRLKGSNPITKVVLKVFNNIKSI